MINAMATVAHLGEHVAPERQDLGHDVLRRRTEHELAYSRSRDCP